MEKWKEPKQDSLRMINNYVSSKTTLLTKNSASIKAIKESSMVSAISRSKSLGGNFNLAEEL